MKEIQLTRGRVALVDYADYDSLMVRSWCYDGGYAWAKIHGRKQSMHRFLMGDPEGMDIDHINNNGCDNRRSNLRIATRAQNMANMHNSPGKTSGFKGVCWTTRDKKWRACIRLNHKSVGVGYFDDEEEAARAYDAAARKAFGRFAKLNFE